LTTHGALQGFHVEYVKLVTVNPGQAWVSSTGMLLRASKKHRSRDYLREFQKGGEHWLMGQTTYL
jgi:hypothetical protein